MNSGQIRANLDLRDTILPGYTASLDEFSQALATRFDAQGLTLFTDPTGAIAAGGGLPTQTGYVGFSTSIQVNPAVLADMSLVRDGTHAVAGSPTGASAFTPNPIGGPAGFSVLIQRVLDFALGEDAQAGVPQPTVNSTGLGPGGNLVGPFGAVTTLRAVVSSLVSAQTTDSANMSAHYGAARAFQITLQAKFDSDTAVDVDAELALMVQLQNAYGANARVIASGQAMWDQLLSSVK